MFSRLHTRFGTAGLVVAVVALIAAVAGTAFAATKLNSTQKKEVKKIAKEFAGKDGAAGPQGPPGPVGPKGDKGDPGNAGTAGAAGETGATGAAGATGASGATGTKGATGATGVAGATGPEGVCSTSNCVLPSGTTETGVWGFGPLAKAVNATELRIPIPFPIRLSAPITETHIFEGETIPAGCTGTVGEIGEIVELGAEPGNLCVYRRAGAKVLTEQMLATNGETGGFGQAGMTGALLTTTALEEGARASGTWAVTAP